MAHDEDGLGREPFFGFLEWFSLWAFISGAVFNPLWSLSGIVRFVAFLIYGTIIVASGLALIAYRRRKMSPGL
jgi:biotin transporter BioY